MKRNAGVRSPRIWAGCTAAGCFAVGRDAYVLRSVGGECGGGVFRGRVYYGQAGVMVPRTRVIAESAVVC